VVRAPGAQDKNLDKTLETPAAQADDALAMANYFKCGLIFGLCSLLIASRWAVEGSKGNPLYLAEGGKDASLSGAERAKGDLLSAAEGAKVLY